ncbi:hypothetical protein [Bradyrhizobium sp. HKCCYLR20261]|uniref:hypothetical protein n=1 Tax=Bradyrhizobium sp. HKCCYLR20261 TaxID=3420760 RepID=UPI003EB69AC9
MRVSGRKAGQAGLLCGVVLFQVAFGFPLAQGAESGGAASSGELAKEAGKDSGPFGGCEPIGLTASGELVFPLDCKKLIKKPAETPVAKDKPAADDKTASTNAASTISQPAGTEAKPVTAEAAAPPSAAPAETRPAAEADKPEPGHKTAAAEPAAAAPAPIKSAPKSTAAGKPAKLSAASPSVAAPAAKSSGKAVPSSAVTIAAKESGGKEPAIRTPAVKDAAVAKPSAAKPAAKTGQADASKTEGNDSGKVARTAGSRPMIVLARPAATTVAAKLQAEDKPRLRTAGLPACVQFRSYNPATRSYRGFDGRLYACR